MTPFATARPAMCRILRLPLPFFLACALSASSHAAIVYVDRNATGSTHNGASWDTACLTVQAGVNAAKSGDEVWVAASGPVAYVENVDVGNGLALYGGFSATETERSQRDWSRNPTVVDGGGAFAFQSTSYPLPGESVVVDGFSLPHGGVLASYGPVTIAHCAIRGGETGLVISEPGTITDCTISGNRHGVRISGDVTVKNCTITGNSGRGLQVSTTVPRIANCLLGFNGVGVWLQENATISVFSHNNVYGNATDYINMPDPIGHSGNIAADPKLSSIYHDIHVQPDSPCINAGENSAVGPGAKDIDAQSRIHGGRVDIGADESDGTAWPSLSRVWHVSPSGSDTNDGSTWARAKQTVGAALLPAQGDDEVWISKGVYREAVSLPPGVALYGGFAGTESERDERDWRKNVTTMDGAGMYQVQGVISASVHGAVVDGLSIRNGTGGIHSYEGMVSVANCSFFGNNTGLIFSNSTASVRNSTFRGNGTGILVAWDSQATITDSTLSGNGDAISLQFAKAEVVNCTATGNTGYCLSAVSSTATVANCLVAFNGTGIGRSDAAVASVLTLAHNNVYGNATNYSDVTSPTGQAGNISEDPKVSNRYRDIHIQPGSPCIDAGDNAFVTAGATDVDGQPRIQGQAVDIGADESDGTAWPTEPRFGYVSASGDDANEGSSWSQAKRSVGAALSAEPGFDEVWVAEGTYREAVIIPAGAAVFGGFAGIETDRGQRQGHASILDGADNKGTILAWSKFADSRLDGFTLRNSVYGIWGGNGTAISSCAIHATTLSAIWIADGSVEVANCTISGNAGQGIRWNPESAATVRNTIVAFNRIGIGGFGAGAADLSHNNVHGNTLANYQGVGDPTGTDGNISADPKFVNRYHDLHIQPDSPCIDAGDDAAVEPGATDIDGQPRIQGARVDIGADESDGTTWPVTSRSLRVSTTGSDASDGSTWALAMRTVGAALAAARGGDEIWVAKGLYTGILTVPAGVALYGGFYGNETDRGQRNWAVNRTGLDGGQAGKDTVTGRGQGILIDGLTIRSGRFGVYLPYGAARVAHSTLTSNGDGLRVDSPAAAEIENSVLVGNSANGIAAGGMLRTTHCTIVGNGGVGILTGESGPVSITSSIIAFNGVYGLKTSGPPSLITLSHNDVFGNTYANYWLIPDPTGTGGNVSADPLFVSRTNNDYRLSAGSPCIDAGDDAAFSAGGTDRDGRPRKLGAHVDIGAHEYGAAYYTMADALQALRIAGGLEAAPADISRLDVEADSAGLDHRDAARLIRKVTGLDANP